MWRDDFQGHSKVPNSKYAFSREIFQAWAFRIVDERMSGTLEHHLCTDLQVNFKIKFFKREPLLLTPPMEISKRRKILVSAMFLGHLKNVQICRSLQIICKFLLKLSRFRKLHKFFSIANFCKTWKIFRFPNFLRTLANLRDCQILLNKVLHKQL